MEHLGVRVTASKLILRLRTEAEMLESVWFYIYAGTDGTRRMTVKDSVQCHLSMSMSPLSHGRHGYTCKRHAHECRVTHLISQQASRQMLINAAGGNIRIKDQRLRKGVAALHEEVPFEDTQMGRSIGQTLCYPVGDFVLVSEALNQGIGILTADRDQESLAEASGVDRILYDSGSGSFSPDPGEGVSH